MAPGSKKKRGQRTEEKITSHSKKHDNSRQEEATKKPPAQDENEELQNSGQASKGSEKYRKGVIESNWNRYEEPVIDPNADVIRGTEYGVLLSYSGGSGSQLQLQEERDWDENSLDLKSPIFDLVHLNKAYKCIPFHKQLHIPEDVFDASQIFRFQKCADAGLKAFLSVSEQNAKSYRSVKEESQLDIVEKDELENPRELGSFVIGIKEKKCLPEKTENLVESLTSCLSLREKNDSADTLKENDSKIDVCAKDDLDFLLSLTSQETVNSSEDSLQKKPNIDEWLNNILES